MNTVNVHPMPVAYQSISKRFRPSPPPIFPGGAPTLEERTLARALFAELDAESQEWYRGRLP